MANNRLEFEGLAELREQLRKLPRELAREASTIINDAADSAALEVIAGYHVRTGKLRQAVKVQRENAGQFGASVVVKNTSKLAWLYDNGSQARHWSTGKSTGQMWGKTPPTHHFVKTVIKHRRRMWPKLKQLITSKGLEVSGDER